MTSDELLTSTVAVAPGLWIGGAEAAIPQGVTLVITTEKSAPACHGTAEVRIPFDDSRWVPVDREALVEAVHAASSEAEVLVRCRHGLNRSALVAALVLRARGMDADAVLSSIRAARQGALSNPYFADLVSMWPRDPMGSWHT